MCNYKKIFFGLMAISFLLIDISGASATTSGALYSSSGKIDMPMFSMKAQNNEIVISKSFYSDNIIHLDSITRGISSLGFSGNVVLRGDDSFARVVLVDKSGKEYLVYEANTVMSGDNKTFSLDSVCEETCSLSGVRPQSLKIEIYKAALSVSKIFYSDTSNGVDYSIRASQSDYKLGRVKDFIERKNLRWEAGETTLSALSYEDKKKFFIRLDGQEVDKLPNLQGLDYYVGGVFEFASDTGTSSLEVSASSLPSSWNWNNVNGKNWLTSFKNQGNAGTCWAFASLGALESQIKMYYNQPSMDINLSEQMMVDCTTGKRSTYAMNQIYVSPNPYSGSIPNCFYSDVNYYVLSQKGIADEGCDGYVQRDVASSPSSVVCSSKVCNNWQSRTWKNSGYYGYQFTLNTGDTSCPNKTRGVTTEALKKIIIEKGPLDTGILVDQNSGHAMVLVGYETDTDGKPIWIFKNSWGTNNYGQYKPGLSLDGGYLRAKIDISSRFIYSSLPTGPFTPPTNQSYWPSGFTNNIVCEDKDGDGYCYWGSSPSKPSTCAATCNTIKDCNDNDKNKQMFDSNYNCIAVQTKVDGVCGSANGQSFSSKPTTNLCSSGTASTVTGTGPWSWTCNGSNGGSNASCSANKTSSKIDGVCGSANGQSFSSKPTTNLCSSGTASIVTGTGPWSWTCNGSNGGSSASCSASKSTGNCSWYCGSWGDCINGIQTRTCTSSPTGCTGDNPYPTTRNCGSSKINGVCGSANGQSFSSKPTTNLCSSGTASTVTGTGPWSWTCNGSNGGSNASCNAQKNNTSVCGPAARHYDYTETDFVGKFCSVGDPSPIQPSFPAPGEATNWNCLSGQSVSSEWITRSTPGDSSWYAIAYGNGTFVAVAYKGDNNVMTSTDGINWTPQKAFGNAWYSITYGDGLFVAISTTGLIMTSPDGINWTKIETPNRPNDITPGAWYEVTYGNGMFVMVGGNMIMISRDGSNWQYVKPPENNLWHSVAYGNGLFVAVAFYSYGESNIMTSPDGINWTPVKDSENFIRSTISNNWISVIYGNGMFVAVSNKGNYRVMTSSDGVNWSLAESPEKNRWISVIYGNGMFVAVSDDGNHRAMTYSSSACRADRAAATPIDGVCGSANGQSFSSKPTTNLCSSGAASTVTGTGPWSWTCNGSNGGGSASCKANKSNIITACGNANGSSSVTAPTQGLCSNGSSPHVLANGDNWTWKCGDSECSAVDPNAPFKKKFAATEMPIFTGLGDSPDTAEVWLQWYCSSGFPKNIPAFSDYEQVSCSSGSMGSHGGCIGCVMSKFTIKKKSSSKINGVCGSANGQSFSSKPTTNLCSSGTASTVTGTGPWSWTCNGSNGGGNAICSANKGSEVCEWVCGDWGPCLNGIQTRNCAAPQGCSANPPEISKKCSTGKVSCGPSDKGSFETKPTTGLCNDGNVLIMVGDGPWYWICQDYDKESAVLCYAKKALIKIDGVCGSSNGGSYQSVPTTGLCASGTPSSVYGNGPWIWLCNGSNGGKLSACFARKSTITDCYKEGSTIPLVPSAMDGKCCSGLTLCPPANGITGIRGTCKKQCEAVCTNQYDPVCGVDGKNYPNECYAKAAGINVLHKGTCRIVLSSGCGASNGISTVKAPTKGLCLDDSIVNVTNDNDGNWVWNCGQTICKATDPNREYKKLFGAFEMSAYTGNPSSPDAATIALKFHCNWLPSDPIFSAYKKVSCKYEPLGSHGGCDKCAVVEMKIEKK